MSRIRLTGMSSGLDSDAMVRDLMKAERFRVDKLEKEKTVNTWRQEKVRELINKTREFQGKYFDLLKPETNLMSSAAFSSFNYSVKTEGKDTTAVTIAMRADATRKNHVIEKVTQLATKDSWEGEKLGLNKITTGSVDLASLKTGEDLEFLMSVGSNTKIVKLSKDEVAAVTDHGQLATLLNNKIKANFGTDYSGIVKASGDKLEFSMVGSEVKLFKYKENATFMDALSLGAGASSAGLSSKTIGQLFGLTQEELKDFKINGKEVKLDASMTIEKMVRAINGAGTGVELQYDTVADKMILKSTKTGSANNLRIENDSATEKVFAKLFGVNDLVDVDGNALISGRSEGKNAVLTLNGTEIIKEDNRFTIEGTTFHLNAVSDKPIQVEATVDADKVVERIKEFVKDYNELITALDKELTAPKYSGYTPLTEEEKAAISEKQVEKIEERAKSGILRGNREIEGLLNALKGVIVDKTGDGATLRDIGIQSEHWLDRGKLSINEGKLKNAINTDLNKVTSIFTKVSSHHYNDESARKTRYEENGVAARLDDVLKDYVRTTRDKKGNKGRLVNFAGVEKDGSYNNNQISKAIKEQDNKISQLMKQLNAREDYYYRMFAQMEAAMSKMQSQQSSMMGLFGGMGGGR